ncbi:MAG TPA: polysaccharide biosynthesis C-terminal domain-containing protein, partial [Flavisolibacter sp.]
CSVFLYGWWQPITIILFLQLQLFSFVLVNLSLFFLLFRKRMLLSAGRVNLFVVLRQIAPFGAIILLMGMHYRLDGFLLERLRPDGALQAGIYATAYRLLDAANMIGYLTASFLVAFVARNRNDKPLLRSILHLSLSGLLSVAIATSWFALVFPTTIQKALYHTADPLNDRVIQLCLAVLPAYYLIQVYGSALTALAEFGVFIRILLSAVAVNIAFNFFLIPSDGAVGCCIAALISHYGCAIACYFAATKRLAFPRSVKPWVFFACAAVGLLLLLFLLKTTVHRVWIILAVSVLLLVIIVTQLKSIKTIVRLLIQQAHA